MTHTETVQDIYRAFSEGDIARILSHLSDSVEWEYGANTTDVPWLQPRRGAADAAKFFEALGALEFHRFTINHVIGSGDVVVGLVSVEATVRATGRKFVEEDEVHIWYFDSAGKVARFRHRIDTYQQLLAYKNSTTT
jgi:ketosteroid isomerase-like protein